MLAAWDARDAAHKFQLVCMVHNVADTYWQIPIPEWSSRNAIRLLPISEQYIRSLFSLPLLTSEFAVSRKPFVNRTKNSLVILTPIYLLLATSTFPLTSTHTSWTFKIYQTCPRPACYPMLSFKAFSTRHAVITRGYSRS